MNTPNYASGYRLTLIGSSVILLSLNAVAILLLALVCLNGLVQSSSFNSDMLRSSTIAFLSASGISSLLFATTISSMLRQAPDAINPAGSRAFVAGLFITVFNFLVYSFFVTMQ